MRRSTRRQKGPAYDLADSEDERPTMGKGFSFSTLPFPNFDSSQNKLDWNAWRRKFERYRLTSRLIHEQDEVQVSVLLLSMGDDAEDIYESFSLKSPSFNQVVDKFNKFYEKKTNIVYERAKFNRRSQLENESAESFVVNLYKLIKTCSYGPLHDELLRDRLVVGVRDQTLSETLQMDPNLTLESAIARIKLHESVKGKQDTIRSHVAYPSNVETLVLPKTRYNKPKGRFKCFRCGEEKFHKLEDCKARSYKCKFCGIVGHLETVCRKKEFSPKIGELCRDDQTNPSPDDAYLDTVELQALSIHESIIPPIKVQLLLKNELLTFKVDTGADVTCIPQACWDNMTDKPKLVPYKGTIEHAGRCPLTCLGKFSTHLRSNQGKFCEEAIYVIKELKQPLLGRTAIKALSLLTFDSPLSINSLSSLDQLESNYKGLFASHPGLLVGDPYRIKLKSDAVPYAIAAPRRIPLPLYEKVRQEIARMEELGIIERVDEATEWCSPIVVVPKRDGSVRLCVDFTKLNEYVMRERYILPSSEEALAVIGHAKFFSKLDARMGFWQIPLDEESRNLTTFISPFGRHRFRRLPFGICSAPEHFQRRLRQVLTGIEGCTNLMDDILVFGNTLEEHDKRLHVVLEQLQKYNITLNKEKCEIARTSVIFLGHEVTDKGIRPDQSKVKAILEFPQPKNVTELKRFFGMYNYLSKFIPNASKMSHPLQSLLRSNVDFTWDSTQQNAFESIKKLLASPPLLQPFDPNAETRLSTDSSSYALGAVLEQKSKASNDFQPIVYISRALIPAEINYAQIEKEALGISWACERLSMYLKGLSFSILTDHKPLVSLLGTKAIHDLSPRIQRFRLRLLGFDYTISHVSGKNFYVPDTLSRVENLVYEIGDVTNLQIVESSVDFIHNNLPVSDILHSKIAEQTKEDVTLQKVIQYIANDWERNSREDPKSSVYYKYRDSLTCRNGLVLLGHRIVIPQRLKSQMLEKLHAGHLGVNKCRSLAQATIWWPEISKDIETKVADCYVCAVNRAPRKDPLLPTPFPDLPWSTIGCDLMQLNRDVFLVVQDYFSRFLEVQKLNTTTSAAVISVLQRLFSQQGVPHVVRSDNGPQFDSEEFQAFARSWGFQTVTSSPHYPQSNGQAESAVHTAKKILAKCENLRIGLLSYNSSPLKNGFSPSELLMGRRLRTMVPISTENLRPKLPDMGKLQQFEREDRERRKHYFDRRHGAVKEKPDLRVGEHVYVRDLKQQGIVKEKDVSPRSYLVETSQGSIVRRNQYHLVPLPNPNPSESPRSHEGSSGSSVPSSPGPSSRPQRTQRPPERLNL
uniref:RNA-directed DNA polymerase n=1 Tax=Lygus hesperus TaxID=30085 RepID=A0A0A9W2U6_LYGHE